MSSKSEKTYLVFIVLILITCIVLTIFINQKGKKDYTSKVVNNNVHIIHIGGTVAKNNPNIKENPGKKKLSKGYISENVLLEKKLSAMTKEYENEIGNYSIHSFSPLLNSFNMSVNDWVKIGEYITSVYDKYDSFILIHGTDTLAYTASALSFMFDNLSKPIIVSGISFNTQNKRNNMRDNILASLIYASQYKIPEVVVIMDNKIYRGCCTTKIDSYTFDSPNLPLLGVINDKIEINKDLILPNPNIGTIFKPFNNKIRIVVIKLFPGITGEYIRTTLGAYPVHGIIFELFGIGNSPTDKTFLDAINDLGAKMVIMIGISQSGTKQPNIELEKRGVFGGGNMTTEAAFTKLYYLISNSKSYEEAISLISKSLRGET